MQEIVAITGTPQPSRLSASRSEHRSFAEWGVNSSLLGFGAAPIGNLYAEVDDESALAAVQEALRLRYQLFRHRAVLRLRAERASPRSQSRRRPA